MKKVLLLSFVILLGTGFSLQAQKIHVPIKKKATEKTNEEIDKSIDKGLNKLFGKKKKKTNSAKPQTTQQQEAKPAENQSQTAGQPATADKQELKWAKYDFVPGDKVIFEDNLTGEENGEFPSRWDLVRGNVEIAQVNGENVIMFKKDNQPLFLTSRIHRQIIYPMYLRWSLICITRVAEHLKFFCMIKKIRNPEALQDILPWGFRVIIWNLGHHQVITLQKTSGKPDGCI